MSMKLAREDLQSEWETSDGYTGWLPSPARLASQLRV